MLENHPAAEMFPLMSPDELRELADDIQKNGLLESPKLARDKETGEETLLDGRNRRKMRSRCSAWNSLTNMGAYIPMAHSPSVAVTDSRQMNMPMWFL